MYFITFLVGQNIRKSIGMLNYLYTFGVHIHILAYKCTIQYLALSSNIIILINVMYVLSNFLSGKSKVIFISRVVVRTKIGKRNNENIIRFISFLIKLLKSHAIHSSGMYDYM